MYDIGTLVKKTEHKFMTADKYGYIEVQEVGVVDEYTRLSSKAPARLAEGVEDALTGMIVIWDSGDVTVETRETVVRLTQKEEFQRKLGNSIF